LVLAFLVKAAQIISMLQTGTLVTEVYQDEEQVQEEFHCGIVMALLDHV
jgi:hypothetical protein